MNFIAIFMLCLSYTGASMPVTKDAPQLILTGHDDVDINTVLGQIQGPWIAALLNGTKPTIKVEQYVYTGPTKNVD